MGCPACGHDNAAGARFCQECGARLARTCTACATELPAAAKFCPNCGTPAADGPTPSPAPAPAHAAAATTAGSSPPPMVDLPADALSGTDALPQSFVGDRYRVVRFLGRGGRKSVYLARDTRLDREVAVAVIPTDTLDADGAERVRREARAMARLGDHPNIVAVYDTVEEPAAHLIISQFMPGGDLSNLIRAGQSGRLELPRAIAIATELCRALTHAHGHGVLHRDLKPANVFLGADGEIRLGDFGLARLADNRDITLSGSFLGTAAYMPPEQALGGTVDARSDLYALGCVLYEMIAARPPFTGDDTVSVIGQQLNAAPVPPSWHEPAIPPGLDRLVLELLSKTPSERPSTSAEVAERLAAIDLDEQRDPASQAARPASGNLVLGRLVGRHRELASLRERIDQAAAGQGSMTMLVGEPGIGKTRLSQEAATFAGLRDAVVLWGRCYESEAAIPYRPWSEILGQYVRSKGDSELRLELGAAAADVARIASEVGDRLGGAAVGAGQAEAEADRLRLFDSVASFLLHAAQTKPLLIIVDDLHWADTPSLLLLQHLARRLPESRICVIGTYRDVDLDRQHPLSGVIAELRQRRLYDRIRLHGFDAHELRAMLAMAGQQDESTISDNFLHALLEETEGNPFFVEETLRHLVESGKLYRKGAQWVSNATSISDLEIPEGVREVIGRRLSRLSERCNDALRHGAVLGREFEFDVLRAMTQFGHDDLLTAIEEALDASIIREFTERPGVAAYQFTHALVQQTLLDELSLPRRQRLHFRAAEAIEATAGRNISRLTTVLAAHYRAAGAGGDLDKALRYTVEAEEAAEANFAWEEAAALWRAAVELMEQLQRPAVDIARYHLDVFQMGRLGATGIVRSAEVIPTWEWCREVFAADPAWREDWNRATFYLAGSHQNGYEAESLDIRRSEQVFAEIDTDDPALSSLVVAMMLNVDLQVPRPERLIAAAEAVDPESYFGVWAAAFRGSGLLAAGRFAAGQQALMHAWHDSTRSRAPMDAMSAHIAIVVESYFMLGGRSPGRAGRFVDDELALGRQTSPRRMDLVLTGAATRRERGEPVDRAQVAATEEMSDVLVEMAKHFRWLIAARDGRIGEAIEAFESAHEVYSRAGGHATAVALDLFATDLRLTRDEADSVLSRLALTVVEGNPLGELAVAARRALAAAILGTPEPATTEVARARALLARPDFGDWGGLVGMVDLAEALLCMARGHHSDAAALFESAVASARRETSPWDEAEVHLRWGRALAAAGDVAAAMPHFDEALTIYQRIEAGQPWVERVLGARLVALGQSPDADASTSVLLLSRAVQAASADRPVPAELREVALLFSDIEGSTSLNQRLGDDAWLAILGAHNDLVERATQRHGGTVVKSMGDGFMLAFPSPVAALRCATDVQRHLDGAPPPLEGIRVRIGVHVGPAVSQGGDYFGLQVALAARVANAATGGEVLVSQTVAERVAPSEFTFGPGRTMTFKGIADEQTVHSLERQPS